MKLILITIALVSNYLLGWTYETRTENHKPEHDTVIVAASHRYSRLNPLKWFFLGENYREEWSTPVAMQLFHLNTTKGGFTIERLGGGEQTKSLHLVRYDGTEWVLRSVDKNVSEALPEKLRGTFIQGIVQDQISAAYPYAILTIYDLSEVAGVPAPTAELYYVPDDPALGKYRPVFAHSVCFLSPKAVNGKDIETLDTDTCRLLLDSSSHYLVLQEKVLAARLLDMLIADWDRHKNQWEWGSVDSIHTVCFFPVPEDRDQAFFLSTGMLTRIVRLFGLSHLSGFRKDPAGLKQLNGKAHSFDRYYLNRLGRKDWERSIRTFQGRLNDSTIRAAVRRLPPEIYEISGEEIVEKLESRRNGLLKQGLRYYDFLAREVTVSSSREPEIFSVSNFPDSTLVTVVRADDRKQVYHRVFYPDETRIINLSGLTGQDKVHISGDSDIRINKEAAF